MAGPPSPSTAALEPTVENIPSLSADRSKRQETGRRSERWFWQAYAATYDALPRHFVPYTLQLRRVVEMIQARHAPNGSKVLDAGCGTGNYVASLRAKGYDAIGLDNASWMLHRAAKKTCTEPRRGDGSQDGQASYCKAALTSPLPFANGSFDCVISINALYMLERPEDVLAEFSRILRPAGTLILSHPRRMPPLSQILFDHARKFGVLSVLRPLYAFAALGIFNWIIARNFSKQTYACWSGDELGRLLTASGFRMETIEPAYACDSNLLLSAINKGAGRIGLASCGG